MLPEGGLELPVPPPVVVFEDVDLEELEQPAASNTAASTVTVRTGRRILRDIPSAFMFGIREDKRNARGRRHSAVIQGHLQVPPSFGKAMAYMPAQKSGFQREPRDAEMDPVFVGP